MVDLNLVHVNYEYIFLYSPNHNIFLGVNSTHSKHGKQNMIKSC